MGLLSANKELSASRIECGGTFDVTLSLRAAPDISEHPADIVLVLDRSRSMLGSALEALKEGANTFIDIIAEATGGAAEGQIGAGSRIGIVSFASTATKDTALITSVADLKDAVDALEADGRTNHADAFTQAIELLTPPSGNERVIVIFTDGETTVGADPSPIAASARADGIIIYAIGLSGADGVDEDALDDWASKPSSEFVAITPNEEELAELFANLARDIAKPGATEIRVDELLTDCFEIVSISEPTKGEAVKTGDRSLRWEIETLGETSEELAQLTFTVRHNGVCEGTIYVNEAITYEDAEGQEANFPSPRIDVSCGGIPGEPCPTAIAVNISGCEDTVSIDVGELALGSLGRILQLSVTLQNVCPNRRVALAVILTELDDEDREYQRGMKTITVPAHTNPTCTDVLVRCIRFVLPEDLDESGSASSICNERRFRARLIAHYIDNDFACCDIVL